MNRNVTRNAVFPILVLTLVLIGALTPARTAHAQNGGNGPNPGRVVPLNPQYADLSARWWQWIFSQPASTNPNLDTTGAFAHNGQPTSGDIFFLAGSFSSGSFERWITIPAGTRLFFPVINAWNDILGNPDTTTVAQLRAWAAGLIANTTEMHGALDGVALNDLFGYRALSPVFSYWLPPLPDNLIWFLFAFPAEGSVYPSVADGYYLLLTPLSPGQHTLTFGGTNDNIQLDITYHITVTPGSPGGK
jgi:hypothetical protein